MKEDGFKNLTIPEKYYMSEPESEDDKKWFKMTLKPSSMMQQKHDLKVKYGICSGLTRKESRAKVKSMKEPAEAKKKV